MRNDLNTLLKQPVFAEIALGILLPRVLGIKLPSLLERHLLAEWCLCNKESYIA